MTNRIVWSWISCNILLHYYYFMILVELLNEQHDFSIYFFYSHLMWLVVVFMGSERSGWLCHNIVQEFRRSNCVPFFAQNHSSDIQSVVGTWFYGNPATSNYPLLPVYCCLYVQFIIQMNIIRNDSIAQLVFNTILFLFMPRSQFILLHFPHNLPKHWLRLCDANVR